MRDHGAELWERAQRILGEALEMSEEERQRYVEQECKGDHELLREVRSLLHASREASGFFQGLADVVADAADQESSDASSLVGHVIGHFDVRAAIGRGGMGEVYRAVDQRLGREVALKVLPTELTEEPLHVVRFRREARIIASLRHPNVAAIYGVEEIDDRIFLVLELVEGETLKEKLAAGPLAVREALEIARQVAEGLEAAHDIGVVHRDLKPANVKVDPDGQVRILDFGIAKPPEELRTPGSYLSASPSTPLDVTRPGMVLGTAAYMSPEQARGKPIDQRSDVWSFGALVYELLSGRKAFDGEDLTQIVARILESDPDWEALVPGTPETIEDLLRRCLEKNVRRRLQAIGEARIALEDALSSSETFPRGPRPARRLSWGFGAAAATGGLLLGLLSAALVPRDQPEEARSRTLRLAVAEDASFPLLSPTGDRVTFAGDDASWVVFFDGSAPRRLEGTEGGYAFFWSPDGRHLGFVRDGSIWRVPADGGQVSMVGSVGPGGFSSAAWLDDGTILASVGRAIVRYPELGGAPQLVWALPEEDQFAARGLEPGPDGGLFMIRDGRQITLLDHDGISEVYTTDSGALIDLAYAPPNHLLFRRRLADSGIWALPITRSGAAAGRPFLVSPADERPSTSHHGDLAYLDRRTSRQRRNLVWVDRAGEIMDVIGEPQARLEQIDVSPSGRRAAAVAEEDGRRRVWIHDLESGERFALSPMPDPGQRWPRWAFSEDRIAFRYDDAQGGQWIGVKSLEPGVAPIPIGAGVYPSFTTDDRLLFNFSGDIYRTDPRRPADRELFIASPSAETEPRAAANGLVAFLGQTPTGMEVFVTRYDEPNERWQVSEDGGSRPKWRNDGRELYYLSGGALFAVSVEYDGDPPRIGRPTRLFAPVSSGPWSLDYDPSPNGERFLMLRALPRADIEDVDAIVLIQNWAAGFQRP
jgi:serine/threonine protein kinase/dipeptidyl aminopeptidase/acylaminoacyl peptidase